MRALSALFLLLCSLRLAAQVSVVEPATRAVLAEGHTAISLALKNRAPQAVDVRIDLTWLDPAGRVNRRSRRDVSVPAGDSTALIPHPLCETCNPLAERLEYLLTPVNRNHTGWTSISGRLSLPNIADYAFSLSVLTAGLPVPGRPFELRVLAAHPITGHPVHGVRVSSGGATALTDVDGLAILNVTREPGESGSIGVVARIGDFESESESTPLPDAEQHVRGYTDKAVYQPGQTMHVRVLAFDASGRAEGSREFDLRISDDSGELHHSATITTSPFGVASADWEIPQNVAAGQYTIALRTEDAERYVLQQVSIRSYELPSFRISATPLRTWYLPDEAPEIEIRGEYLFGKPVGSGKVRIVAADDNKTTIAEGMLDDRGIFRAILDNRGELCARCRYADRHYVAFLTDLSTNRTEQRRFDVRVSRSPLHVYAVRLERSAEGRRLYLTTWSPDGKPLLSDIEVARGASVLGRGRTNRFGVVRIDLPPPVRDEAGEILEVRATAGDGRTARLEVPSGSENDATDSPVFWLTTDRNLYLAGQPVRCVIGSSRPDRHVLLIAFDDKSQVVFSKALRLRNGRAEADIPYDKRFGRVLNVAVAAADVRSTLPVRRVYFPGPGDLVLQAAPARPTYRPGETATINFQASSQAALGIAIVDQSVLERASTDSAFSGRSWFERRGSEAQSVGGMSEADLLNLDGARITDPELQLVAEVLSACTGPLVNNGEDPIENVRRAFQGSGEKALGPIVTAVNEHYLETLEFPADEASFERIAGAALRQVQDPWLQRYHPKFSVAGAHAIVTLVSSGPDKTQDTADDIAPVTIRRRWFAPEEALIRGALKNCSDYPASAQEFVELLAAAGLRFDALHDPWGGAMRVVIDHALRSRIIRVLSSGPDRAFGSADDFVAADFKGPYFSSREKNIDRLLEAAPEFPSTTDEFRALLLQGDIAPEQLRDRWGRPYYLDVREHQAMTEQVQFYTYAEYQRAVEERRQITQVRRTTRVLEIRSVGEDGVKGTYDDFYVAAFRRILRTPEPPPVREEAAAPATTLSGTGIIAGVVLDPSGAVVPNAEVKMNDLYLTRTDEQGEFTFRGTPPGKYRLTCQMSGFRMSVVEAIPVTDSTVTHVQLILQIGYTSQTVEVAAEVQSVSTASAYMSAEAGAFAASTALSTPRVREYFPETLYWHPELVTDSSGRASVRVKLADSVTTWRVLVFGSTIDGRIAQAGADVRAFQPFLVELDIPPLLTAGDEISIPVPVRNYTEQAQKVTIAARVPPELPLLRPVRDPGLVPAASTRNAVLYLRAEMPSENAPVRVTAAGRTASDAIEKRVSVHPDGERRSTAIGSVITKGETLRAAVSSSALPGTISGKVKIYPSVFARILEAIEVLLEAPHGCGEQTISSTYPNLLFLKALRQTGLTDERLSARALSNLRAGYQRLLRYQSSDGGFTYWGHGDPDVAVTAYALTFLDDARPFISVDEDVRVRAYRWLAGRKTSEHATNALRMYALAGSESPGTADVAGDIRDLVQEASDNRDAYALAAGSLAAMRANKPELARSAVDQLLRMSQGDQDAAWWAPRAHTPYRGWGRSGQIESTAMVVSALARWRNLGHDNPALNSFIDRGALFLLRNTAEGGAWATSQASARALTALLDSQRGDGMRAARVEVRVNGAVAGEVQIPGGRDVRVPLLLDISRNLRAGDNLIAFDGFAEGAQQVQLSASWYEPWGPKRVVKDLDMQIEYRPLIGVVNDPVTCDVVISRPAYRDFGMMIASIGLPPGADVDRGVLEEIVGDVTSGVDAYEVAPDHVTFYIWPRTNEVRFRMLFRPRFAMKARASHSVLYDFYNPESRVVLKPETFTFGPEVAGSNAALRDR